MTNAVKEFPFVEAMPKREAKRIVNVWDQLKELKLLIEARGQLLPQALVAKLLNVSKQRVSQLVAAGKLEVVDFHGHPWVSEKSVIELARSDRKTGRPMNTPETNGEMWKRAKEYANGK
jgi:predicted XRE-type DNA-binding protein